MYLKTFLFLTFSLLVSGGYAQVRKVFLDENGAMTDSAKAKSYLVYRQISDTSWFVKQYDIDNTIVAMGTYRDAGLSIQHGNFIYYSKEIRTNQTPNPKNYVHETGAFINGKRNGTWLTYFPNGMKVALDTYIDDKQNGLHETYNDDDTVARVRGYYLNDMKDGEWSVLSKTGKIMNTQLYKKGKVIKSVAVDDGYKSAIPPKGFGEQINSCLSKIIPANFSARIFVQCLITKDGKLLNPALSGDKVGQNISDELLKAIANSGQWGAPYDTRLKQPVEDTAIFIIDIKKGNIEVRFSNNGNKLWHQMNN